MNLDDDRAERVHYEIRLAWAAGTGVGRAKARSTVDRTARCFVLYGAAQRHEDYGERLPGSLVCIVQPSLPYR